MKAKKGQRFILGRYDGQVFTDAQVAKQVDASRADLKAYDRQAARRR